MNKRFRSLLATIVGLAASLTMLLGLTTTPAHAGPPASCDSPQITGAVQPSWYRGTYYLRASATGYSPQSCVARRWEITFDSYSTGEHTVASSSTYALRGGGQSITFPTQTFTAPMGSGHLLLSVVTETRSILGFWYETGQQTYQLSVPTGSYDTASMQEGLLEPCQNSYIQKGWC